jgi:beta-lactam-binding protein with PASTA domain
MGRIKFSYFLFFTLIFFSFSNFVNLAYPLEKSDDSLKEADFLADTLYTDPISLEIADEEQQIEIIIARWGSNEQVSEFELSIKSTPTFMKNVKWVGGSKLEFKPDETEKIVTLSFKTKAAKKSGNQDIVLIITSSDSSLIPKKRQIVLPFQGPRLKEKSEVGTVLITVCPENKDNKKTDQSCGESIPVYAGESYKVFLDPGIDWNSAFELKITDPDAKEIAGAVNDSFYLNQVAEAGLEYPKIVETEDKKHPKQFILRPKFTRAGKHTIEIRSELGESSTDQGSGLLGTQTSLGFKGEWKPVGTYEILPAVIHYKGFVVEPFAALKTNSHIFSENTSLEMSTLETRFSEPLVDIVVNGSWKRKDCKKKATGQTILETSESQVKINFPVKINLVQNRGLFEYKGVPFELPVEIISMKAGKAQFKYCEDIDDAAFDISFPGLYFSNKTVDEFMADHYRSPGFLQYSHNLEFEHPGPVVPPFGDSGPVHYYVRGPDSNIKLKVKTKSPFEIWGDIFRSQNVFVMPVAFSLVMWNAPKDQNSRSLGDPLMGYAIYGAKPGAYTGPVPAALGTPKNLKGKDGAEKGKIGADDDMEAEGSASDQIQGPHVIKASDTDQTGTSVQGEDRTSPSDDTKAKEQGLDPDKPESLNPNHPKIAAIIKEWISVAEPPSNAIHGNNFHYSNRGVAVGQGKGFTAKSLHESGVFDPGFLWRNKQDLDSVNHCTLGEFVVARLKGSSIDYCKGRYKAKEETESQKQNPDKKIPKGTVVVPDLIGKPAKNAKKTLSDKGFKVELQAGKAAPSPQKAFTVTNMDPKPGSFLKKGKIVKITVFMDFVQQIKIPAISGLSTVKAKKKLQDAGFKVKLKTKGDSPSPDNAFKTIGTDPVANSKVVQGSTITLISFGPYKDQVAMPSLIGLKLDKAETLLEKLGLKSLSFSGKPAPKKEMENNIITQEPLAGEMVSPRSRIRLNYYDTYKWQGLMPDLAGLSETRVRKKIEGTGLAISIIKGKFSPSNRLVNKVYKQSPSKNSRVKEGDKVKITIYGKTKDQLVEEKDCSHLPGTEPFWYKEKERPGCQCKDGYVVRDDKSGCDKKKTPVVSVPPPTPAVKTKVNSTCDKYYNRLNQLITQQQQISSKMMGGSGNSNDYACQALEIAMETIQVAKKARASGCKIDGNHEQAAKLMMQTYSQMCKSKNIKPSGGSQAFSSVACNWIKNPGVKMDKTTRDKAKNEIKNEFKKLFTPVFTSIFGSRSQDPWKMGIPIVTRQNSIGITNSISVVGYYKTTPKLVTTQISVKLTYYFGDMTVVKTKVETAIKTFTRLKGEKKSFDGMAVISHPNKQMWDWASTDKTMLLRVQGYNKNVNYWALAQKFHKEVKNRGLYNIKSKLPCW